MNDAKRPAQLDDESSDAEMSEEQIWDEIDQEEGTTPAEPDDTPEKPEKSAAKPSDDDTGDADDHQLDDDDAEDADGGGSDDAPAGTDLEALQAQNDRLQRALKSEKGRTAANRREIERLRSQIAEAEKTPRRDRDEATLKARKEKLKAAREEYGDVVGPLADTIEDLESRLDKLSKAEAKQLEDSRGQYASLVAEQRSAFLKEHPDGFDTIIKHRQVFDGWIEDQPKALRDIYAANKQEIVDGNASAYLVGLFKEALFSAERPGTPANPQAQRLESRRRQQLAGARTIRPQSPQRAAGDPPPDGADEESYWAYWDRKDKASAR